jgi:hypothetical protein
MSKCAVSPRVPPSLPTVGSPAPAAAPDARRVLARQLDQRAEALDRSGPQLVRSGIADQPAALKIIGVREERRDRHRDEIRIAIECLAVGKCELCALDLQMDEVGAGGVETVDVETFKQCKLLQHHRALAPRAGLADRVAPIVVAQRRFDAWRPARHIVGGKHAAVALSARVHHLLRAAETINRLRDEAPRPGFSCLLDLRDPVAAGAFSFREDADTGRRQRLVGEQRSRRRYRPVRQIHCRRRRPMLAEKFRDRCDGGMGTLNQRMAVLRISDRRRDDLAQRHGAVVAQQEHPGLEGSRHASGKKAAAGHEVEPFAAVMRDGCAGRRRSLAADYFRLAAPHLINDDRHIAARAVEMRFDDLKRECGGNCGVEGVPPLLQRCHADGRGDPMRRSDDAERAVDFRTRREWAGIDAAHTGGKITRRPLAAIGSAL